VFNFGRKLLGHIPLEASENKRSHDIVKSLDGITVFIPLLNNGVEGVGKPFFIVVYQRNISLKTQCEKLTSA